MNQIILYNKNHGKDELKLINRINCLLGDTLPANIELALTIKSSLENSATQKTGNVYNIEASNTTYAARLIGELIANNYISEELREPIIKNLGIMLDCSRNAVMRVAELERWMTRLALLGYNEIMLYMEDTYEMDGEEWFGLLRGSYTKKELLQIRDCAEDLGIELIPCIQTLGHLEQVLKWPAYDHLKDDHCVFLTAEEKTYILIEKIIAHWKDVWNCKRIHVGMDEAWSLGLGRHIRKHGYTPGGELFMTHLQKVSEMCESHDLTPMIWSDMPFRLAADKADTPFYPEVELPSDIIEQFPKNLEMAFWNYGEKNPSYYESWFDRHSFSKKTIMAAGMKTWNCLWYDKEESEDANCAVIQACENKQIDEVVFTMWGDDGAYCVFDSAFVGLVEVAEKVYRGEIEPKRCKAQFDAIMNASYDLYKFASAINLNRQDGGAYSQFMIWDDPMLLLLFRHDSMENAVDFTQLQKKLSVLMEKFELGKNDSNIQYLLYTAEYLKEKYSFVEELLPAYYSRDLEKLSALENRIDSLCEKMDALALSFRNLWLKKNKAFGLEVMQIRFSGQTARFQELKMRLRQLIEGEIDEIEEWEARFPKKPAGLSHRYRDYATTSCIL